MEVICVEVERPIICLMDSRIIGDTLSKIVAPNFRRIFANYLFENYFIGVYTVYSSINYNQNIRFKGTYIDLYIRMVIVECVI